jgi:hypothetical protein
MAYKNDVADDMAPVGHSIWPLVRPSVWPPLGTPSGPIRYPVWPRWASRLAPRRALHLVPFGTLSGPRWAPHLDLVWHPSGPPSGTHPVGHAPLTPVRHQGCHIECVREQRRR